MSFLMGLNDSFSQISAQLLLMEPEPSINRVFALVTQESQQRAISSPPIASSTALLAKSSSNSGDSRSSSSNFQGKRRERLFCTHCGLQCHTIDRCYKLSGFPPDYRSRNSSHHKSVPSSSMPSTDYVTKNSSSVSVADSLASLNTNPCKSL